MATKRSDGARDRRWWIRRSGAGPEAARPGLLGPGHRSLPVWHRRAAESRGPRAGEGRHPGPEGPRQGRRGGGRGHPSRLHLERSELRAESGAEPLDQLRLLRAAREHLAPGGRAPVRLRLDVERVRDQRRAGRHRGPSARPAHRLQQVQGDVRADPARLPSPGLHHRDHPPRHRLRLLAAAAAGPDRQHPHEPRGQPAAHHHLRRRPEAPEHPHRGHQRPLRRAARHAGGDDRGEDLQRGLPEPHGGPARRAGARRS